MHPKWFSIVAVAGVLLTVACSGLVQTETSAPTPNPTEVAETREKVCDLVEKYGYEARGSGRITWFLPKDGRDRQPLVTAIQQEFSEEFRDAERSQILLMEIAVQFTIMYDRGGPERSNLAVPAAFWRVGDNLYSVLGLDCDLAIAPVEFDEPPPGCSLWRSYRSGEIGREETVERFLAQLQGDFDVLNNYGHRLARTMNAFYAASLLTTELPDDDQVFAAFDTVSAIADDECGM